MKKLIVFYILISVRHLAWASRSNVAQILSCPGDVVTIECAIMGSGITVWQGTALQCDSHSANTIALRHTQFEQSQKPRGTCNNGDIVATALGVVNNSYISQLNVTVSPDWNNTNVECSHDYNLTETIVRSIQIIVLATGIGKKQEWR